MRALLLREAGSGPPADAADEEGDQGASRRIPDECVALVWRCLSIPEQMCCSSPSASSRRTAPPVVHLAAATQRLQRALSSHHLGRRIREMRSFGELLGSRRQGLRPYVPAASALLCGLVRCPLACRATRQCAVGSLGWLFDTPRHVCETFADYDCDVSGPPVMEPCLEALGWAASREEMRPVAVEVLVGIMRSVMGGIREAAASSSAGACSPSTATGASAASGSGAACAACGSDNSGAPAGAWAAAWDERRRQASEVRGRTSAFNRSPEAWWAARASDFGAEEAARFLLENRPALDGARMGEFLGQHEDIMSAFVRQFQLRGLGIVPAFLRVLRGLHMPGEAQQVDRFCERFGAAWGEANGIDPEAAYIFAFSLVMVSTDLHRPPSAGHQPMTFPQFEKSLLSALHSKERVPHRMVKDAYEELKARPLISRKRGEDQESPTELCAHLRKALRQLPPVKQRSPMAPLVEGQLGFWRTLWSAAWGPMLGAFSAGAHGAGENEAQRETALRGLQLGCQAAVLLEEVEQAEAFSQALQQLSVSP